MIPKFRAWGRNGNYPGSPSEKFEMFDKEFLDGLVKKLKFFIYYDIEKQDYVFDKIISVYKKEREQGNKIAIKLYIPTNKTVPVLKN